MPCNIAQIGLLIHVQLLSSSGLSLVYTEQNLVDIVWEEHCRPKPPSEGLIVMDVSYTGQSFAVCFNENFNK